MVMAPLIPPPYGHQISTDDQGSERGIDRSLNIPEALQNRIRIIAEQGVSLRRLRQSIFSECKQCKCRIKSKRHGTER